MRGPVMDLAGVMSRQDRLEISALLNRYHESGRAQVQVLVVPTLNGVPIEEASIRTVEQWKLGSEKSDNGVLFLVALKERRMRIEVGQGLEGILPDVTAKRLIEDEIAPYFKAGDLSAGIRHGVIRILSIVDQEYTDREGITRLDSAAGFFPPEALFILLLLFLIFLSRIQGLGRYHRWSSNSG
ncbi:MAG: TPM domain-containing protein [Bdellovibrionaceae bacterium]|nr:TPM domain-containing protein [Pseudobdellovibrionaceae bacterium]